MINILLAIAVLPAIILIYYVYAMDKVEKEPIGLLSQLILLGAAGVIPAAILETVAGSFLKHIAESYASTFNLIYAFLIVGLIEEGLKYFIVKIRIWKSAEFNFRFDAIVYTVCVGLGFALFENILYVIQGGISMGLIRAITAIPAHAINAVFMGHYLGQAKFCKRYGEQIGEKIFLRLAFWIPVVLHGFYDFCAMEGTLFFTVVFVLFVIVMDVLAINRIQKSSKEDTEV